MYFIGEPKENHWGILDRRMFGAVLTLKKTNIKERVDWVGEWQQVALTESYSRIKISVYRRVERDSFSLELL